MFSRSTVLPAGNTLAAFDLEVTPMLAKAQSMALAPSRVA